MNLVIVASLTEPPTESLPFRYVTMIAKTELSMDVLIETERQLRDSYYHFLKSRAIHDYISDLILVEDKEEGVRLDTQLSYPKTIKIQAITFQNTLCLLGQIKFLSSV